MDFIDINFVESLDQAQALQEKLRKTREGSSKGMYQKHRDNV